ncbi:hypothetical protein VIGAN_06120900 [Vigna angularis var. angularis]|uniref:Uncharacterized protein n=1 Tax=Vigna angularis var. angularis TaxID=157739 RepID=A0A0S3SB75_PHAAN|nr:hypothetical protein VIGAN_06120900 [Vigna angularis var. angularis]
MLTWHADILVVGHSDWWSVIQSGDRCDVCNCNNFDMQLAIALQQQEFEQQPSRQNYLQQSSNSGNSRLVTGPRNICLYYN